MANKVKLAKSWDDMATGNVLKLKTNSSKMTTFTMGGNICIYYKLLKHEKP